MPRLQRKIGHLTGEMSQMSSSYRRNTTFSARVSLYDNNASINSIRKEKYTLVRNPLRTKMSTMSGAANQSKSLLGGSSIGPGSADPEQVLKDLKRIQRDKMEERKMQLNDMPSASTKKDGMSTSFPSIKK